MEELQNYEIHVSDQGHDQFGAKIGSHDDLVTALAMAVWWAERPPLMLW